MFVEEVYPWRMGFAGDLESAELYFGELFRRHGLLAERHLTLFAYFCRRWSGKYCGAKRVREWKSMWRDEIERHDRSISDAINYWD